jgi:hypothetical protein
LNKTKVGYVVEIERPPCTLWLGRWEVPSHLSAAARLALNDPRGRHQGTKTQAKKSHGQLMLENAMRHGGVFPSCVLGKSRAECKSFE